MLVVTFLSKQVSGVVRRSRRTILSLTTRGLRIERGATQSSLSHRRRWRIRSPVGETSFGEQLIQIVPGRLRDRSVGRGLRSVHGTSGAICQQLVVAGEAIVSQLLLVEGHRENEVGVVDGGVRQHERHRDDRTERVHLQLQSLELRRIYNDMTMVSKIVHKFINLNDSNLLTMCNTTHNSVTTRGQNKNVFI